MSSCWLLSPCPILEITVAVWGVVSLCCYCLRTDGSMTPVDAVKRVLDDFLIPNAKYDRLGPRFRNNFLWRAEVRANISAGVVHLAVACIWPGDSPVRPWI
jgi:hypothetical protein